MGDQIRVVIADDHRLLREMLRLTLRQERDIKIVGEAANGLQAIDVISELKPDIVLLDIIMPEMDGIKVLPAIREKSPKTKALMLTAAKDEAKVFKALKAGAKGYLSKDVSISDLIKAIQAVHKGELWVERKLMARFVEGEAIADPKGEDRPGKTKEGLTPREQEVLRLLSKGSTNKEIAKALFISELKPDIVLLDIIMPEMDGIKVLPAIREKSPKTKALMLTVAKDEAMIFKALKAGAKGYLSKDVSISDLIKAIQAVHQGELWVERKLMARFFEGEAIADPKGEGRPGKKKEGLTSREQEVLRILSKGSTNKEIAKALFISEKTVKSHLNSIFKKLNVSRRLQAILYAIKRGLS